MSEEINEQNSAADKWEEAIAAIDLVLDIADDEHLPAPKQALLSGILRKITPDGETTYRTFQTGTTFFVCINERPDGALLPCCTRYGSRELLTAFQEELARRGYPRGIKVSGSTCMTSCQYGPTVVVYPEGISYGKVTSTDVASIFEAHLLGRGPVERLLLPPEVRVW
jgi:(2Fe-2S) ferredoxin